MYTNPNATPYDFSDVFANSSYAGHIPEAIVGVVLAIFGIFLLIFLVVIILTIIINWKLLEKMGNEGWKAIIPVYNTWSLCEGIGLCPHWAWITVVASAVLSNVPVIGPLFASVVGIYFTVIFCISLSRSFGKSDGFAVLLFFFYPIVGFFLLKNDFLGAKPCHDYVFDDWIKLDKNKVQEANVVEEKKEETKEEEKKEEVKEEQVEETAKFCTSCGQKIEDDTKFCPGCGKEVN